MGWFCFVGTLVGEESSGKEVGWFDGIVLDEVVLGED